MTKLLIATTNQGKFKEIKHFLGDLPFEFLSLKDIKKKIVEPIENGAKLEDNAIIKATYYGEKTGLLTLSEDSGIFIKTLKNYPGVKSARIAKNDQARRELILKKMKSKKNRVATFAIVCALYNPKNKDIYLSIGFTEGKITKKEVGDSGFAYDPIFYVNEKKKTYAEMTIQEKNNCSHRGKALGKIKYFLANQYGTKHIVVPIGIIANKGKILICKRNDPANSDFHGKWEFPGGVLEFGETMEENVVRELLEETNYKVEVIERINDIHISEREYPKTKLQVILIPFVCKIIEKNGDFNDAEIMEMKWVEPKDYLNYDYIGENKNIFIKIMPEIKRIIKEKKL